MGCRDGGGEGGHHGPASRMVTASQPRPMPTWVRQLSLTPSVPSQTLCPGKSCLHEGVDPNLVTGPLGPQPDGPPGAPGLRESVFSRSISKLGPALPQSQAALHQGPPARSGERRKVGAWGPGRGVWAWLLGSGACLYKLIIFCCWLLERRGRNRERNIHVRETHQLIASCTFPEYQGCS